MKIEVKVETRHCRGLTSSEGRTFVPPSLSACLSSYLENNLTEVLLTGYDFALSNVPFETTSNSPLVGL